jgi:uncharacterized protein YuzE
MVAPGPEAQSGELSPDVTVEMDAEGQTLGIEILNASRFVRDWIMDSIQSQMLRHLEVTPAPGLYGLGCLRRAKKAMPTSVGVHTNPGEHAALDIGVVYGGRFGAVGQTVSFPWQMADGFFAPYEVTFLANRWARVGDEPVLLMRLEHAMEIIESHSPTSVPRAVELWVRREFPTLQ